MSRYSMFIRDEDWFLSPLGLTDEAAVLGNCGCSIEEYVEFKAVGLRVLCMGYSTNGFGQTKTVNIFILLERSREGEPELLLIEDYQNVREIGPICEYAKWKTRAIPLGQLIEDMDSWRYEARYGDGTGYGVHYEIKRFLEKLEESSAPVPTGRRIRA